MVRCTTCLGMLVAFLIFSVCGVYYGDLKITELQKISPITTEVQSQLDAYGYGITLAKIMVILSISSMVFLFLSTGFLPTPSMRSDQPQYRFPDSFPHRSHTVISAYLPARTSR